MSRCSARPLRLLRERRYCLDESGAGAHRIDSRVCRACARQIGFWHDTVSLFERNYDLNPTSLAASGTLGVYWSEHGDPKMALGLLAQNVEQHPEVAFAHYTYANVLLNQNLFDDAIHEFQAAIALDANRPRYYTNYGVAFAKSGHPEAAITTFEHAMKLDPTDPDNYQNAGIALVNLGRKDEARNISPGPLSWITRDKRC